MAYYLTFGNFTQARHLVITTDNDGETITEWNEILGAKESVTLRYDSNKKNAWTPFIKTSLEIVLHRQNDGEFADIINGNDQDIKAYLLKGSILTDDYRVPADSTLLFKGTLTMGTWTERYNILSPVKLIFHDKIGHLKENYFFPRKNYLTGLELIGECLLNVVEADEFLVIDWPYSYDEKEYIEDFIYNIQTYIGKTKEEVLSDFLVSHGLQIFTDFTYKFGTWFGAPPIEEAGAIRIRLVANQAYQTIEKSLYKKTSKVIDTDIIYYYERQDVEDIITEEINSSLLCYIDDNYPPVSSLYTVFAFEIDSNKYYIVYKEAGGDLTSPEKVTLGITAFDDYEVIDNYSNSDVETAIGNLIGTLYTLSGGLWVANTGSDTYNFTLVEENITDRGYYQLTEYQNGEISITTGKFDETRIERILDTIEYPLMDRATMYNLEMKAKYIEAVNNYEISESIVFPMEFYTNYIISNVPNDGHRYFILSRGTTALGLPSSTQIKNFLNGLSNLNYQKIGYVGDRLGLFIPPDTETIFGEVVVIKNADTLLNTHFEAIWTNLNASGNLYYYAITNIDGNWYTWNVNETRWDLVSSGGWGVVGTRLELTSNPNEYLTKDSQIEHPSILSEGESYKIIFSWLSSISGFTEQDTYLTDFKVTLQSSYSYPDKLILRTNINEKNRQIVNQESKIYCFPDIEGSESIYQNGIYKDDYTPIHTLTYRDAAQTLLAHVSDQMGANYTSNRWALTTKFYIDYYRLHDLFTLEDRSFIIMEGNYDVKRGYFDANMAQIILPYRLPAWQWEDEEEILWEDETRMLEE